MVPYVKWEWYVDKYFFFFNENIFPKEYWGWNLWNFENRLRVWKGLNFVCWKSVNKVQFKIVRNYPFNETARTTSTHSKAEMP